MDNLPPAGFQFAGDDYGPVDFPSSLPSDMQPGLNFAGGGGGSSFSQNQRGAGYGMSPFQMNYSQQGSIPAMSGLPSGSFRGRFTDYPSEHSPHLAMSIPSAASGMVSDRLPSFSTIVSSSGGGSEALSKSSQALYTSISAQQLSFQGGRGSNQAAHFDSSSFPDQLPKGYSKSPSLGSASPGIVATNYANNIPHSAVMQHNGSSQHLSPRSYKEEITQQQYVSAGMHLDRPVNYGHGGLSQNPGESMTLPKFKHKYHNPQPPRRTIGPFKFFIIGKTSRPSIFNKGTQTTEQIMPEELTIKIPKKEISQMESDHDFSEDEPGKHLKGNMKRKVSNENFSPRITFPYDASPNQGALQAQAAAAQAMQAPGEFKEYPKNSKFQKTVISPSMEDAAGKATMTTCIANKATIVTVGIVSRPQPPGSETTPSSTNKNVMSTGNIGYQPTPKRGRPPKQSAETMDQLMQERMARARDLEQERMEVSVRIDDTQYIQVGSTKRWQCNECDKSYTTKHNLVMHVLDHSGIKPHLCLKCGKYFKQLSHLNTHMLTHDKIKPHTCTMCGKGFTQISHLKRHLQVSEKNGYCANLRKRSSSGQSPVTSPQEQDTVIAPGHEVKPFSDHSQNNIDGEDYNGEDNHEMGDEDRLMCRYCDKKFRYPSQLKEHMHSHNGSRPYMCTECGMDFMKEHHLKAHQFTHTGLKPYTCDTCGRSFNQRANLQRHKLIHDTTRSYKCNICNKLFTQPQTLKAHQVVHAERKPFECNICGKEFGRYHNLQGHMHMHSNSKPYVCFCGSTFTLKGNLNRHKKVKHGLNETTDVMEEEAVNFLSSLSERARDDYAAEGSPSPGSGADGGINGGKARKALHYKDGDAGVEPPLLPSGTGTLILGQQQPQQHHGGKPFVIQNPDTDEELEEEEEEGEIINRGAPGSVMNFQPLNMQGEHQGEGVRPRRQSQRHSPHDHDDEDTEVEDENTDSDWVPGARRKRSKVDV